MTLLHFCSLILKTGMFFLVLSMYLSFRSRSYQTSRSRTYSQSYQMGAQRAYQIGQALILATMAMVVLNRFLSLA